jgi:uncharacterized protein (DUF1501 family)
MAWDISRRVFLRSSGVAAVGVAAHASPLLTRMAEASQAAAKVFVHVFLRGGADGLNMLVPHGDPDYYTLRQMPPNGIAIPRPGQNGGAVNIDGFFGFHPGLAPLKQIYDAGRLALLPAVGNYGLTRSHFDAQDFTETGTPGDKGTSTGWLDRAIKQIPGSSVTEAVAFQAQLPRSFLGPEPVLVASNLSQFDIRAPGWRAEAETLLRAMYEGRAGDIARVTRETFDAINTLLRMPAYLPANGASYPNSNIGNSLRQAAQLIKAGIGTRTIFVSVGGSFDTHQGQLQAHNLEMPRIGDSLLAFYRDLGPLLDDVVLLLSTEFGRASFVNGSQGTDHGSAHLEILMGAVRGGRVVGGWPGLSRSQLYQQRDLAMTIDYRDVFAEIARRHLGLTDMGALFPGYTPGPGPGVVV